MFVGEQFVCYTSRHGVSECYARRIVEVHACRNHFVLPDERFFQFLQPYDCGSCFLCGLPGEICGVVGGCGLLVCEGGFGIGGVRCCRCCPGSFVRCIGFCVRIFGCRVCCCCFIRSIFSGCIGRLRCGIGIFVAVFAASVAVSAAVLALLAAIAASLALSAAVFRNSKLTLTLLFRAFTPMVYNPTRVSAKGNALIFYFLDTHIVIVLFLLNQSQNHPPPL